MTERDALLFYISRLSDERIHRLLRCASENYAAQKDSEPVTLTEKALCTGVLANLDDRFTHYVYVFAKQGLVEQEKAADRRERA